MLNLDKVIDNLASKKFAIATSGGSDSMALCHLCKDESLEFIAIIVDHKYRDKSSDEAKEVKKQLSKYNIESIILENEEEIPTSNIEKILRDVRYKLIIEFCKSNQINTVLTGHHLDDNIETFMMRLERGAGVDGLTGIKFKNIMGDINFIRPFLEFDKDSIKSYLRKNNLKYFEDESNLDTNFTRNNIRKTLQGFSDYPTLRKRISGVMTSLKRTSNYVEVEVAKATDIVFLESNIIDKIKFLELHEEIALKILKNKFLQFYTDKNKFRFEKILRVYEFIKHNHGKTELAGVIIEVTDKKILFLKD